MIVCGIDPGLTGAVAWVKVREGEATWADAVEDMPLVPKSYGKPGKLVEPRLLFELLKARRPDMILIERVGAMPGQGVTSMFAFGRSLGVVEGVVASLGVPYEYVLPDRWKRRAGLSGREKDEARAKALQMFPEMASLLTRKADIGRADALLIATFGRQ